MPLPLRPDQRTSIDRLCWSVSCEHRKMSFLRLCPRSNVELSRHLAHMVGGHTGRLLSLPQELLIKRECAEFLALSNWQHWCHRQARFQSKRSTFIHIAG